MNYKICEANYGILVNKLTRLNTKLTRIGVQPITFKTTTTVDEPSLDDANKLVRFMNLEVEGTVPKCNGWSFLAVIVQTEEGNIVRSVPGFTAPPEYREKVQMCDHCNTRRIRRDTYVVRHDDGRTMQVGSSCLADFLTTSPDCLVKAAEIFFNAFDTCDAAQRREWLGGSNAIGTYRIDLDTFLNHVAAVVLKDGRYITRKMASIEEGMVSTSRKAYDIMCHPGPGQALVEITPAAEKLAEDARAWVLMKYSPVLLDPEGMDADSIRDMVIGSQKAANRSLSEFEHNLLACARAEAIEPRFCGCSAYIIEAYRRSLPLPVTQLNANGLMRIFKMFDAAVTNLKRPAIRLADDAGHYLHLSLAAKTSRNAGSVYVKGERGSDAYYGKITPEGRFFQAQGCPPTIEPQLRAFAADPEKVAKNYGTLTGRCCFCGRLLTDDRSTDVGYGPVCAGKFGLNWGIKTAITTPELVTV